MHKKKQGLTQKKLAKKAGVTKSMVADYKTFRTAPKLSTLLALSAALGKGLRGV